MKPFTLNVSTPDGNVFTGEVEKLFVKGIEGDLMVMADHVPFVTAVKSGEVRLYLEGGAVKKGNVESGVLTVSHNKAVLLTGSFVYTEK